MVRQIKSTRGNKKESKIVSKKFNRSIKETVAEANKFLKISGALGKKRKPPTVR